MPTEAKLHGIPGWYLEEIVYFLKITTNVPNPYE